MNPLLFLIKHTHSHTHTQISEFLIYEKFSNAAVKDDKESHTSFQNVLFCSVFVMLA